MSITLDGIEFEHHEYDSRGDVLYLAVSTTAPAVYLPTPTLVLKDTASSGMRTGG
jgi:hypothetical protein